MEAQKTLQEVSKSLGISTDKARYWLSLLDMPQEKRGRVVFLPDETVAKLSEMARQVAEGFQPGEAAKRAKDTAVMVPVNTTPSANSLDMGCFMGKMDSMEKAVMLLVESHKTLAEENRALRSEVSLLRGLLPAPVEKPIIKEKVITAAPIRAVVIEPAQKEITTWKSLLSVFDDVLGLVAGRG